MLHDIGKIAVRTEILTKPGPLTDEEFAEIKQHTLAGRADARAHRGVRAGAAADPLGHERWDGGGYRTASRRTRSRSARA